MYKSTLAANVVDALTVLFVSSNFAVSASENLHIKVKFRALEKLAGNSVYKEGGKYDDHDRSYC